VSSEKRPSSDSGRKPTMARDQGPNLTSIKRGPGYRSSFSGTVATVFGATGMIGTACCNRLGKGGSQIIIPYRGDHYEVLRLKVAGDLGQVLFSPYDIRDEDSVRYLQIHLESARKSK
jgi:NADH dehydrogenase (ubiquinone) 1 alpha subcomplex subunit 9